MTVESSASTVGETENIDVPESLSSAKAKLIYLYVAAEQQTTVRQLCDALDLQQIGAFPILADLERHGLVQRDGEQIAVLA